MNDKNLNTKENKNIPPSGWAETILGEVCNINPTESLSKGKIAKSVPMAYVDSFTRQISNYEEKEFKGGTKFRNGDTLFARITPCLENGKTAYVDFLGENEVGFGSTEYIIIREKQGLSDKKFLYYMATSPHFREIAIKAMTGTSGRQRVQTDVLVNKAFFLPSFSEQQAIASVLSAFDDKIELLREENKTLEEIGKTIYKEWFGKYSVEKPEELPAGWRVGKLGEELTIKQGRYVKAKNLSEAETEDKKYPIYGANGIRGYIDTYMYEAPKIVFGCRGLCGNPRISEKQFSITNTCMALENEKSFLSSEFIYFLSKKIDFESVASGSAQPQITVTNLYSLEIIIPDQETLKQFDEVIQPVFTKIRNNSEQIHLLACSRDEILPKLMSGKIRLSNFNKN